MPPIAFLAAWILAMPPADSRTVDVTPRVTKVSLFKNGFAYVVSEVELPAGPTWFRIRPLPVPVHGTLSVSAAGSVVKELIATGDEKSDEVLARSISELLSANQGRDVVLDVDGHEYSGKLITAPQEEDAETVAPVDPRSAAFPSARAAPVTSSLVILETRAGVVAFERSSVRRVQFGAGAQPSLKWNQRRKTAALLVHLTGPQPATKLVLTSLQSGLAWVPSYRMDIATAKKGELDGTATLVNDLFDLHDASVQLVSGFPNLAFANVTSPLGATKLQDFFDQIRRLSEGDSNGSMFSQQVMFNSSSGPSRVAPSPTTTRLPGEVSEDLYYYDLGKVTLARGQRASLPLMRVLTPYEHVYKWEVTDPEPRNNGDHETPQEVWHSLRLTNVSSAPWTTAPLLTVRGDRLLGQDTCFYTPPGAQTLVKITKALGVQADAQESEKERKRETLRFNGSEYDRVSRHGDLTLQNFGAENIDVEVVRTLEGTVEGSSPKNDSVARARNAKSANPIHRLTWHVSVGAGKTVHLTYDYSLLVRP